MGAISVDFNASINKIIDFWDAVVGNGDFDGECEGLFGVCMYILARLSKAKG